MYFKAIHCLLKAGESRMQELCRCADSERFVICSTFGLLVICRPELSVLGFSSDHLVRPLLWQSLPSSLPFLSASPLGLMLIFEVLATLLPTRVSRGLAVTLLAKSWGRI